jgi:two-component system chemotaxis response regulator CheY
MHACEAPALMSADSGPVILVVEDNAAMRALIRSLLVELAAEVHECEDGERAIALYRRVHPDWVLMDIAMSGMDGIRATRRLKKMDPDARVVIVTDHGDRHHREKAVAAGACAFVPKDRLLDLPSLIMAEDGA